MKTMTIALGLSQHRRRGNGLRRLSGSWSEDEFRHFETNVDRVGACVL